MKQRKIEDLLFECLQGALWGHQLSFQSLDHDSYQALIDLARKQTVQGLVGDALIRNEVQLERMDAIHLFSEMQTLAKENDRINQELVQFVNALDRRSIEYIIVKGQVMAALYPNPRARVPGDVDMYFVGEHYFRAKKLVEEKLHVQLEKFNDGKHVEFNVSRVTFELHNQLSRFALSKHQVYWNKIIDKCIEEGRAKVNINNRSIQTLRGTYNVLFIFVHLFYHMTASGLGLRQLCDFAIILSCCMMDEEEARQGVNHNSSWAIDKNELEKHLKALGYWKAFNAVGALVVDVLGLPESRYPFQLKCKDRKWVRRIKRNVLKSGNFGRSRRKVKEIGLMHSLESGWLSVSQTMTYYQLAPQEVLGRGMDLTSWFVERFKINWKRDEKLTRKTATGL